METPRERILSPSRRKLIKKMNEKKKNPNYKSPKRITFLNKIKEKNQTVKHLSDKSG